MIIDKWPLHHHDLVDIVLQNNLIALNDLTWRKSMTN